MKTKEELNKGITLIVLVVTIVIILILAIITINTLIKTGLIEKTKQSKIKIEEAEKKENKSLDEYERTIGNYREAKLEYSSNYINTVEIKGEQINDYINVYVNITKKQEYNNLILILFKNGKLYDSYKNDEIKDNNIKVNEIKSGEDYKFYVLIIDEDGGIIKSNEINMKSSENVYTWKKAEYPVLSENKINNMEYSDQYGNVIAYKKDLNEGACNANDALPIEAWDDNTSTAVRTGTYYIKIAEDMIGKSLVWTQYWTSGCTSIFAFCDKDKNELNNKWWSDVSGSKQIEENTKYLKYYSNGHYLYEISGE